MNITNENFKELLESGKPMLLDFWAEWCGPCRMVGPIIDELSPEYDGRITIGKINVDSETELTKQYGIRNIPTLLFLNPNGEVVDKIIGAEPKEKIKQKLDKML